MRAVPIHTGGTERRDERIVHVVVFVPAGVGVFRAICRIALSNFVSVVLSVPLSHCLVLLWVVLSPVLCLSPDLVTVGAVVLITLLLDFVLVFLPVFLLLCNDCIFVVSIPLFVFLNQPLAVALIVLLVCGFEFISVLAPSHRLGSRARKARSGEFFY